MRNHLILLAGILMFSLASCTEDFEDNDLVGAWEAVTVEIVWTAEGKTQKKVEEYEPLEWVVMFDKDGYCYSYEDYLNDELEFVAKWRIAASSLVLSQGMVYEHYTIDKLNSSELILLTSYEEDDVVFNVRINTRKIQPDELN